MKIALLPGVIATCLMLSACQDAPDDAAGAGEGGAMTGHDMASHGATSGDSPATAGYKQSMTAMMEEAPPYTGDADVDFMQQMKVHHEAAIAMSETVLEHGKDAETRALAEAIIREQRREISEIDAWLAKRGT
ncbi:DUF305 domain-containing protein [Parerythrobacter aurantius]|uniref:DUF305 domain-containing protein n=1 Tax=Parerythrobacter aurantius TaxID=3127706 RepID=UPI00324A472C